MSINLKTVAASVVAVGVLAGAAAVALWHPDLPFPRGAQFAEAPAATEAVRPAEPGQQRFAARPPTRVSEVFRQIDPDGYDKAIAESKLDADEVDKLKKMLPEGKVRLAGLVVSGHGQTISVTGAGLSQTVKLDAEPQTLIVPYVPGAPVVLHRDKDDAADAGPADVRFHLGSGGTLSNQALVPGADIPMSTPK